MAKKVDQVILHENDFINVEGGLMIPAARYQRLKRDEAIVVRMRQIAKDTDEKFLHDVIHRLMGDDL